MLIIHDMRNLQKVINKFDFCLTVWVLATLVLNSLMHYIAFDFASIYLHSLFQFIRVVHDYTLGLFPIPSLYIAIVVLISILYLYIKRSFYLFSGVSLYLYFFWKLILGLGVMVALFYWTWGFLYHIDNHRIAYQYEKVQLSEQYICDEVQSVQLKLDALRSQLQDDTLKLQQSYSFKKIEDSNRLAQEVILKSWAWPTIGKVRVRKLQPSGFLMRFSASGIYIPHTIEGHIDAGLYHVQHPFTAAHEMAHGYGFTDEGFCNFVGFVTCLATEDAYHQYSAWLAYYRYLMNDLYRQNKMAYYDMRRSLSIGVRKDIAAIYEHIDRYPDFFPKAREVVYDQYLKSHGVKEGIVSYSLMTEMVYLWKIQNPRNQLVIKHFD